MFSELDKIKKLRNVKEVNGKGLVAGITFKTEEEVDKISKKCIDRGLLLVKTKKNSIKIGPPLTITEPNLKKGLQILYEEILNEN